MKIFGILWSLSWIYEEHDNAKYFSIFGLALDITKHIGLPCGTISTHASPERSWKIRERSVGRYGNGDRSDIVEPFQQIVYWVNCAGITSTIDS